MMTTSDDDTVTLEYEHTPVEDDVADDRRSDEPEDKPLNTAFEPSDDDPEPDNSRRPLYGADRAASPSRRAMSYVSLRNVASGNVALMETNRAPVLRKLDRKAILTFIEKREVFLRNFRDANTVGPTRSLRSMIETTVLETICECELGVEVEDVTDAQIEAWINQALKDDRSQDSLIDAKMK